MCVPYDATIVLFWVVIIFEMIKIIIITVGKKKIKKAPLLKVYLATL